MRPAAPRMPERAEDHVGQLGQPIAIPDKEPVGEQRLERDE